MLYFVQGMHFSQSKYSLLLYFLSNHIQAGQTGDTYSECSPQEHFIAG